MFQLWFFHLCDTKTRSNTLKGWMIGKGEREGKTETYETISKLQQRVGNIERIGTRKLTEGLKHKKMKKEASTHQKDCTKKI